MAIKRQKRTYKELCHEVTAWLKKDTNGIIDLTPKELWELDPRGYLWHLFVLDEAMQKGLDAKLTVGALLEMDPNDRTVGLIFAAMERKGHADRIDTLFSE